MLMTTGHQEPRVSLEPTWDSNYWEDVVELAAAYGLNLDPWQQNVLRGAMGERADGRWAATRVGLSVPRQSGKTALLEARELAGLILYGERLVIHSAHLVQTALEGFQRIKGYFENYDDLRKKVRQIRTANGEQGIELLSGQRLRFMARSKQSARGFSADSILLDEAQVLTNETWAAMLPTTSARPNPQVWLAGTPPTDSEDGAVFSRMRDSGNAGTDERLCWKEWSAADGSDLDDRTAWATANPGLGIRIPEEAIADERLSMDDETFARERLGQWSADVANGPIDPISWSVCADIRSTIVSSPAVAVDVSPDNRFASIGVAGWRADGLPHVEMVENRAGTGWIVDYLAAMNRKTRLRVVVVDSASPAAPLIPELEQARLPVKKTNALYMGTACAEMYQRVMANELRHLDQPTLNSAVSDVRKRNIGTEGLWGWNRKNTSSDITPMVAVTLAQHSINAPETTTRARVSHAMYGFN